MNKKVLYDPLAELQLLPQFPKINPNHLQPWIEEVERIDPDRLPWHVRRLSGIGGSEIGVLVGQLRGYFHPHVSAPQLVRSKLLIDLPVEPDGPMMRGQIMEEPSRNIYRKQILERFPKAKPRDDIIKNLGNFRDSKYPWLIGTPDEVMEMEPGKIWIVDYKCPSQDVVDAYQTSGVPFYYSAQLHHYRYIAEQMGYKISGLQLAALNWKSFGIDTWDVPYDPLLEQDCLFAGTHYWNNFVLTGEIPYAGTSKKFGNATDLPENLVVSAVDYATYRHIANYFSKLADNISDTIQNSSAKLDPNADSITVGIVDLKAKRDLDIPAMAQTLIQQNVLKEELLAPSTFDTTKMLQELAKAKNIPEENIHSDPYFKQFLTAQSFDDGKVFSQFRKLNLDLTPFIKKEHISYALSRGKTLYADTLIKGIKEELSKEVTPFAAKIQQHMIDVEEQFHMQQPTKNSKKPKH